MELYKKWKKDIEKKLTKLSKEPSTEKIKIPAIIKRCPVCHNLTLEYDPKTGRIYCTKCGFEEHIPMMKEG